MEIIKESAEGLDRRFTVRIARADLDKKLNERLEAIKGEVHLKGFRKGKAPIAHLRKVYGRNVMGEIVQEMVSQSAQKAFSDRNLQPAQAPHPHFLGDIDAVIEGKADLEYDLHGEVLPAFEPMDVATLTLKRPVADVPAEDLDKALKDLADQQKTYVAKAAKAKTGDQLLIDYAGTIEGAAFDGGTSENQEVVLGSNRLIPGFEAQLEGAKAGEERTINVAFPDDYHAAALAGKNAEFLVKVREVRGAEEVAIDDDLAKKLGLDGLDDLKKRIKERFESDYGRLSRGHVKRTLLDKLDAAHVFDLPKGMVDAEFNQIWAQVEAAERDEEDKNKSEDELKAEYRKIAERRVRLGLVLAEIGKRASVQVPADQLQRAVQEQAVLESRLMRLRGQDVTPQQVLQFFSKNPQAVAQIRAPLYEEQVVDYILERATVTDKKVSKDDLFKDPEGDTD